MLEVYADKRLSGRLYWEKEARKFIFNYLADNPISLTMPFSHESYVSRFDLHPIFDMRMPEGYLFEVFVNLVRKELGYVDDFEIFRLLAPSMEGWLTYNAPGVPLRDVLPHEFSLEEVLDNEDPDLFARLVEAFLYRSAVSGIQPKVIAELSGKAANLTSDEYIVKAFGPEFPALADNERYCMGAFARAGIPVPWFSISKDGRLFVVRRFDRDPKQNRWLGFEEFCVLLGKRRTTKYQGSCEKIAKAIFHVSQDPESDLRTYYAMVVMNSLLKNGDAHLKNFGVLYEEGFRNVRLAPAYDVVCTVAYLPNDKPALSLHGRKVWPSRRDLIYFGTRYCLLSEEEAALVCEKCEAALWETLREVERRISEDPGFASLGDRMARIFRFSLDENLKSPYKTVPKRIFNDGILASWANREKNSKKKGPHPGGACR